MKDIMLNSEKDFGTFLKRLRMSKGVTLQQLASGLMSKSMLSMVENGLRQTDYQIRNRLMERLGYTAEGYEDYLQASEYKRYLQYVDLMEAVEDKNTRRAYEVLEGLLKTNNQKQKIEYQFLLDMKARIFRQEGKSMREILEVYDAAVQITLPHGDKRNYVQSALSAVEYYLLTSRLECLDDECVEGELDSLLKSLEGRCLRNISRAKVLPKAALLYAKIQMNKDYSYSNYVLALEHINEAIDVLRDSMRTYYMAELLQNRKELLKKLKGQNAELELNYDENNRLLEAFKSMNTLYGPKVDINDDCYIYRSSEVYSLGEIIKSRRKIMGISRSALRNVCDDKTLARIENQRGDTQDEIARKLLLSLKLPARYRCAEISTNDIEAVLLYEKVCNLDNEGHYALAKQYLYTLRNLIDYDEIINRQSVIRLNALIDVHSGQITKDEFVRRLWICLRLSGITPANAFVSGAYYTWIERLCIYNIVTYVGLCGEYVECIKDDKAKLYRTNAISCFELEDTWCASELGNSGMYEESTELTKDLIRILLKNHRASQVPINAFNVCWNEAKSAGDYSAKQYSRSMEDILFFCMLYKKAKLAALIEARLQMHHCKEDWTV